MALRSDQAQDRFWWVEPICIWAAASACLYVVRRTVAGALGLASDTDPVNDYLEIASHGSQTGSWRLGWFPGYPLAIRGTSLLGLEIDSAARAITIVSGVMAAVLLATWVRDFGGSRIAVRCTLLAFLLWPNAFVVLSGVVYSDGLFVALALGACVALERDRQGLAALLLFGACATRFAGVAFVIGLMVRSAERGGSVSATWQRRRAWPSVHLDRRLLRIHDLVPALGLAGVGAYLGYCAIVHDDALAYFRIQDSLTPSGPRWHPLVWSHQAMIIRTPDWVGDPGHGAYSWLAAIVVVLSIASIPGVVRRYGAGYGLSVALLLGLIWFGPWDFSSAFRYLTAAFPLFAYWGDRLASARWPRRIGLAVSAAGLVWFSVVHFAGMSLATW